MAAAHGGYTTVCAMPNLNPVPDSPGAPRAGAGAHPPGRRCARPALWRDHPRRARRTARGHGRNGAAWPSPSPTTGAAYRAAAMMRAAMLEAQAAREAHRRPLRGQRPPARRIHPRRALRPRARPPRHLLGERVGTDRARPRARARDGLRLPRLPHLHEGERRRSSARPRPRGVNVTCETGPHYLLLDEYGPAGGRAVQDESARCASGPTVKRCSRASPTGRST